MLSVKWTSPRYMIPKFFQKPSLVTLGSGVLISIVQTEVHCVFKKDLKHMFSACIRSSFYAGKTGSLVASLNKNLPINQVPDKSCIAKTHSLEMSLLRPWVRGSIWQCGMLSVRK